MVKIVGADKDVDQKVRKTIGWYNKQGNLNEEIQYKKVAPLLNSLTSAKAGAILKQLEGKEKEIQNPTAWIAKAAKKAGANAVGGGDHLGLGKLLRSLGQMQGYADVKKIGRTVGWYNKQGNLKEEIRYKEICPLLSQLPDKKAGQILKSLEGHEAEVSNPTGWLINAAKKAGAGQVDKKVSKTIGWYNKQGKLAEEIKFNTVSPLLSQLDTGVCLWILKSLDGKEGEIKNPTNYILSAARKAGAV